MKIINISEYFPAVEVLSNSAFAQALYDDAEPVMNRVLLTSHGEDHRVRRAASLGMFDASFIMQYSSGTLPYLIGQSMANLMVQGSADLLDIARNIVIQIAADLVGISHCVKTHDDLNRLCALVLKFNEAATLVHSRRNENEVLDAVDAALGEFERKFLSPAIMRHNRMIEKYRKGELKELPKNAITGLLMNRDSIKFPPDGIVREVAFLMVAGFSSTLQSAAHCFHDIFTWSAAHSEDRKLIETDNGFLGRCVAESLRLHPVSPVAWRRVVKHYRMSSGIWLEEDDCVVINLNRVNRDPAVFGEDAESFQPRRVVSQGVPHFGLTFGAGIHACPFNRFVGASATTSGYPAMDVSRGLLFQLVRRIMKAGAVPDPERPGRMDETTERRFWASYPLVIPQLACSPAKAYSSF